MNRDFLEQLSELDVPAPPVEFDRQFHRRLNRALLVQQTLDLLVRAMPWAILHMARALAGAIDYTLTGRFHGPENPKSKT